MTIRPTLLVLTAGAILLILFLTLTAIWSNEKLATNQDQILHQVLPMQNGTHGVVIAIRAMDARLGAMMGATTLEELAVLVEEEAPLLSSFHRQLERVQQVAPDAPEVKALLKRVADGFDEYWEASREVFLIKQDQLNLMVTLRHQTGTLDRLVETIRQDLDALTGAVAPLDRRREPLAQEIPPDSRTQMRRHDGDRVRILVLELVALVRSVSMETDRNRLLQLRDHRMARILAEGEQVMETLQGHGTGQAEVAPLIGHLVRHYRELVALLSRDDERSFHGLRNQVLDIDEGIQVVHQTVHDGFRGLIAELAQLTAITNRVEEEVAQAAERIVITSFRTLLVVGFLTILCMVVVTLVASHWLRRLFDDLGDKNRALQESLAALESAHQESREHQLQRVQAEKMASLGRLVAGVAHEINTPVGNAFTAATYLGEELKRVQQAFVDNRLRKSDLEGFFELLNETTRIFLANLSRTAELVRSFKLVAVDQTSDAWRTIPLHAYLADILISVRPKIRRTRHHIEYQCPESLIIHSHPGALSQIVVNLIDNALLHGFADRERGRISMQCFQQGSQLHFHFQDDGRGMSEEVVKKIFEPFYTTRRGQGGSGLGLHIVYNQVVQTLGGQISCHSAPGQGTLFKIRFPLTEKN
ncbi:MAG: HAMP domain-containing histidine kinase [Magnetococcales bacterium]|nr:HAMP domain-containing histidine kinase [Magnetococcales bacterium]